jgi:hypothetical protein
MLPVPRLWGVVIAFLFLLGACAGEVDPAVLDGCPGYSATNVNVDGPRLTAKLVLAGTPCNVLGHDIKALDLAVEYETGTSATGTWQSYATSDKRSPAQKRAFISR